MKTISLLGSGPYACFSRKLSQRYRDNSISFLRHTSALQAQKLIQTLIMVYELEVQWVDELHKMFQITQIGENFLKGKRFIF